MKKIIILFLFILPLNYLNAQFYKDLKFNLSDSLKLVESSNSYQKKVDILMNIGIRYEWSKGDSAIIFFNKAAEIAKQNKDNILEFIAMSHISMTYNQTIGNYPLGLHYATESGKLANKTSNMPDSIKINWYNYNLTFSYGYLHNKELALKNLVERWPISKRVKPGFVDGNIGKAFYILEEYDSATKYNRSTIAYFNQRPYEKRWSGAYIVGGDIFRALKQYDSAIIYYKLSIPLTFISSLYKDYLEAASGLTSAYAEIQEYDSAIYYGTQVVKYSEKFTFTEGLLNAYKVLYQMYKKQNRLDSSFKYLEKSQQLSEQLYNSSKINEAQNIALGEETKAKELAEQEVIQRRKLIITSICLLLFAIGIYLNGKRKQKERLRKIEEDRKNNELKAARDLQQSMLPKENPKRADLDIATFIRSSTEVGGDYYDFFPQADGSIFSVCGDATGHGVTSGMMVSVTKAGLNGISPVKPNKILQRLNGVVKRIDLGTLRMSLNIAEITQDEIYLSSAAMPPMYLYKAATNTIEEFMNNGLPLGGLRDEEFALEARNFESGDVLIQLSDGLPEAPNSKGEMYDYDKLKALIQTSCHLNSKEIVNTLIQSVDQWLEGKRNPDDITLVVTKKK
ncbi:MAG: SpoIIE family protein phosphatase [Chitinophagaceae bacterium]